MKERHHHNYESEARNLQSESDVDTGDDGSPSNRQLNRHRKSPLHILLSRLVEFVRNLISKAASYLFNHRYHMDDIIQIVRPFVYVYAVMKYGHKSFTPLKISFALDVISILISVSRLIQASNGGSPQQTQSSE